MGVCIVPKISWMLGPLVRGDSRQTRHTTHHAGVIAPDLVVLSQFGTGVGRRVYMWAPPTNYHELLPLAAHI